MDVPTLMHNLREEVTCSVCIHLFKEPKKQAKIPLINKKIQSKEINQPSSSRGQ